MSESRYKEAATVGGDLLEPFVVVENRFVIGLRIQERDDTVRGAGDQNQFPPTIAEGTQVRLVASSSALS